MLARQAGDLNSGLSFARGSFTDVEQVSLPLWALIYTCIKDGTELPRLQGCSGKRGGVPQAGPT